MKVLDARTARVLATIIVFLAVGAFIYGARDVLIAFSFAVLFAYVLDPWVSWIERSPKLSKGSRTAATLEVYAVLLLAIVILFSFFGSSMANETRQFASDLPTLISKMSSGEIAQEIGAKHGWSYRSQLQMEDFLREHSPAILAWIGKVVSELAYLLPNLFWIILIPILAFFLLKDAKHIIGYFMEMTAPRLRRKSYVSNLLGDLNQMMAQYIRTQLIISALALGFYVSALSALRVPYALILGIAAGILEFLPTIGPALSALGILGVGFVTGYKHLLILVLVLGMTQNPKTVPNETGVMLGS